MTAREMLEYTLVELNKGEAPSLLLEDFNYFINKSIYQYVNLIYNSYEVNQQRSDDLRALKASAVILPAVWNDDVNTDKVSDAFLGRTKVCKFELPTDYYHLLNCVVEYKVIKKFKCYELTDSIIFGTKRLTADMYSQVVNNYYLKPMYKRPYYSVVSESGGISKTPVLELYYGTDNTTLSVNRIMTTYLKTPELVNLTQAQYDEINDTSQKIEFPEYVCHEIVNILVKLLLENSSDQRLQTNIPVNQSIAQPAQPGQAPQQQQR